ncbi:MAG: hypothetical protein IH939_20190 [Acidobacteria bacterium]|nr:hypothetical protein [Acidobacteriota bacterium]
MTSRRWLVQRARIAIGVLVLAGLTGSAGADQASARLRGSAEVRPACVIRAGGADRVVHLRCTSQTAARTRIQLAGRTGLRTPLQTPAGSPGQQTFSWDTAVSPAGISVTIPPALPGDQLVVLQF